MLPIKLVTFDVTGTLLFFRSPIAEKYLEVGLKYGINADLDVIKKNFKHAWKTMNEEHPNYGKSTGLDWKNWWACCVERAFTGYIKPEKKKIWEMTEELNSFYTTKDAFVKRPGTDELLEYLKTKSVKLAVVSNYDPRLTQILELMELKEYFSFIVNSYEFGYPKPDARIFQEVLRLGGCEKGDEAIHIGDDLQLDYLAAKQVGLRAVLISSDEKDLENKNVVKSEVFEDFLKLKTFFQDDLFKS